MWDKKFIHTAFALAITRTGIRTGLPRNSIGEFLIEDLKLKRDLKQRFAGAGVSHVDIERAANRLKIIIYTSRPGHHHRPQGRGDRQAEERPVVEDRP